MAETITLYRSEGNEYQEPTFRLYEPHQAIDARPVIRCSAALHGLVAEDSPEHGGTLLVDDAGTIWSIANALAMGKLRIMNNT